MYIFESDLLYGDIILSANRSGMIMMVIHSVGIDKRNNEDILWRNVNDFYITLLKITDS